MLIGILECGHLMEEVAERHGGYTHLYETLLKDQGFTFRTWKVVDMEFPEDVHDADGWLLSGSRHGAYEDLPFIPPLEDFVRKVFDAHVPMVGICFGHQIIAKALGGKVEQFQKGWAIGPQTYQFENMGEVVLNAWHQDQITELPKGARRVASNPFCENAALVYGDRAFSVQAHPEFSNPIISDLIRFRKGHPGFPDPVMDKAAAATSQTTEGSVLADRIAEFFKQDREASHG